MKIPIFAAPLWVIYRPKLIMKRFILICILGLFCFCGTAQEKKFIKGFSGGMMLHSGYQSGGDNPYN